MPPSTVSFNVNANVAPANKAIQSVRNNINKLGQPLGKISGDAAEFSKSLQAAAARVTAFGAIAGVLTGISRGISGAARATISLNKELTELNTFLGTSRSQLDNFGKGLFDIARKTASDFKVVSEAAKEFARQGLSLEETLKRTESALVLSRISGLGFAESVTSITTALNSFNKAALTAETITNKLVAVDVKFAVSAKDLSQAISRVGSSAEEAGINFDQLNAGVTAVQQITGRGGAVIGNSLKTIFTRVQRPEVLKQLQELGVAVRDQNGALLDAITIFQNYGRVRENLNQVERASTDELLGGVFQINQLKALTRDLTSANSIYASALKTSINATDEATKKNEQLNQSYSASFSQLLTNATQVGAQLGDNLFGPLFRSAPQTINGILGFISGQDFSGSFGKAGEEAGKSFASSAINVITKSVGDALGAFALPAGSLLAGALGARLFGFGRTAVSSGLKDLVGGFAGLGRAGGYIPAFAKEESRARSLGAVNPKAGVIQANIGGKRGPVIVNNQEDIFNVRGQTAIIPKYRSLSSIPSFATGNIPSASNPIAQSTGTMLGPSMVPGATLANQSEVAVGKSVNTALISSFILPSILTATSALARSGKISGNQAELANIGSGLLTTLTAGITTAMSTKGLSGRARLATAAVATAVPLVQTISSAFGFGDLEKSLNIEKLQQQADEINEAFSKNVGKIQELTQTLGKLDAAYKDPSTSPDAIVNLNKSISDITRNLAQGSPDLAVRLGTAATPAEKINIAEEFARRQSRDVGLQQSILGFASSSNQNSAAFQKLFTEFTSSIAGDAFKNLSVDNLRGQSSSEFRKTLRDLDLEPVVNFFNSQGENSGKLLDSYKDFLANQVAITNITDSVTKQVGVATKGTSNIIRSLGGQKEINLARSTAFSKGISSLGGDLGSLGGGRLGGLAFEAEKNISDLRTQQRRTLFAQAANMITGGNVTDQDRRDLLTSVQTAVREIEKQTAISNQTLQVQKEISNEIAKATSFAGGIGATTSAGTRNESFQELLKPFLKARLGAQFGSGRTAAAGRAEFLAALAQQFPGSGIESSLEAESARRSLQSFRAQDIRRSAFQASGLARGLGVGGAGIGILANLRNVGDIARDQVEQLLPTGRTPSIARRLLGRSEREALSATRKNRILDAIGSDFEKEGTALRTELLRDPTQRIETISKDIQKGLETGLKDIEIKSANINITGPVSSGVNNSKGFIPSFANPLRAAIGREKQFVPSSTIRVNQSNKLVNRMNPMGLAVTNTIDEPNGLASIGLASGGFIPNFARAFSAQQQASAFKMAGQNRLYVYDPQASKYYRINREGKILRRGTSVGRIPPNSQIITINDPKYLNRLRTGLPDNNLRKFGATLRNIPSNSFQRYMTGGTSRSAAFNLAEGFKSFGIGPSQPSDLVRQASQIGKSSRLALPFPFKADAIRLPETFTPLGPRQPSSLVRQIGQIGKGPLALPFPFKANAIRLGERAAPLGPNISSAVAKRLRAASRFSQGGVNVLPSGLGTRRLPASFGPNILPSSGNVFYLPQSSTPVKTPGFYGSLVNRTTQVSSSVGRGLGRLYGRGAFALSQKLAGTSKLGLASAGLSLGLTGLEAFETFSRIYGAENYQIAKPNQTFMEDINLFGEDILLAAFGGPAGKVLATARAGYKVGNILQEQFGIGDKLAQTRLGISLGAMAEGIDLEEGNSLTRSLEQRLAQERDARGPRSEMSIQKRRDFLINRAKRRVSSIKRGRGFKTTLVGAQFSPVVSSIRSVFRNDRNISKDMLQSITERAQYLESLGYGSYLKEYARRYRANQNSSSGFIPNFAGGIGAEMMDIARSPDYAGFRNAVPQMSSYYPNMIKNSAEIEVPAVDVYSRMGFPGAKPKNPSEQYAILNPAQQAALGYAADGFVPNFASEEFMSTMVAALEKVFSPMLNKMSSTGSTSNVINVNDQRTYETTSDKVDGIMEFLAQQFPREIGKLGINV